MLYLQDDDSMDKDGNDLDGECSRPQKHAKSPELAREFLLDAATVIFKEQVCTQRMFYCLLLLYFNNKTKRTSTHVNPSHKMKHITCLIE